MRLSFLALGILSLGLVASAAERGNLSVLQGLSDEHSAQFTILHEKKDLLEVTVRLDQARQEIRPDFVEDVGREDSDYSVLRAQFSGFPEGFSATLVIRDRGGRVLDERAFSGLKTGPQATRIALVSCAAGYLYHSDIWEQLNESNPNLVLFLGDNIYGDRPNSVTKRPATPDQLWSLYVQARQNYDFYFRKKLVPALATWDDHDFGTDNGDGNYLYAKESEYMFNAFFAQKPGTSVNLQRGPGIASWFKAFGMEFGLLDNRLFRIGPTGWGQPQIDWMKKKVMASTAPLWLVNGENFFAGYNGHSVNALFPNDFEQLRDMVRASSRPVGFISGDVHFSEISDLEPDLLGFASVEVTASSIHSLTFPWFYKAPKWKNPRRRVATAKHNFVILDVNPEIDGLTGTATSINRYGDYEFNESILLRRPAKTPSGLPQAD